MLSELSEIKTDKTHSGLTCNLWEPSKMNRPDRHNELEIVFLPDSAMTYNIGNREISFSKGTTAAFWGLMPHHIVEYSNNVPYYAITIPFSLLHEWNLPKTFLDLIFKGEVLSLTNVEEIEFERRMFSKWSKELEHQEAEIHAACLLEMCACLKRFACKSLNSKPSENKVKNSSINLVEKMAMYIARNFMHPIKANDVAKEVDLNPDYANSLFKKVFCSTISNFIIDQRLLFAEVKLTVSDESITSLAFQSGFNSISRFNAAFKKKNKVTPREFRKYKLTSSLSNN